jgi:hypothetical protein
VFDRLDFKAYRYRVARQSPFYENSFLSITVARQSYIEHDKLWVKLSNQLVTATTFTVLTSYGFFIYVSKYLQTRLTLFFSLRRGCHHVGSSALNEG